MLETPLAVYVVYSPDDRRWAAVAILSFPCITEEEVNRGRHLFAHIPTHSKYMLQNIADICVRELERGR
jgi:hypothetical protein